MDHSALEPTAYSRLSDQQLNELLATRLDQLDGAQRRALFTEVKSRMNRHKGGAQTIRFRTERRYGRRIIRQSDGTLVRIQTRVVRVRPVPDGRQSYGVGFEERNKDTQSSGPDAPPVQTVNDRPR